MSVVFESRVSRSRRLRSIRSGSWKSQLCSERFQGKTPKIPKNSSYFLVLNNKCWGAPTLTSKLLSRRLCNLYVVAGSKKGSWLPQDILVVSFDSFYELSSSAQQFLAWQKKALFWVIWIFYSSLVKCRFFFLEYLHSLWPKAGP